MRKTWRMREIEHAHKGRPIDEILVAALDAEGTMQGAARALGIPRQTVVIWCLQFGIELERPTVRRTVRTVVDPEPAAAVTA